MSEVTVRMDHFKECKHSHRFQESTTGPEPAKIGNIYVPKKTLKAMDWKYGEPIKVSLSK